MGPRAMARTAGFLYLAVIAGGAFAEAFVRDHLIVHNDAAATAANIAGNEMLYRLGFVADLAPLLCNVFLAALFWGLFKVVDRGGALLVVFFSLIGSTIQAVSLLFDIAPLLILKDNGALSALGTPQLQALSYLFLRLHAHGYTIALIFFGGFGMTLGTLIIRSRFMPALIGALMVIAGLCYFTNGVLDFVAPQLSSILLLVPCLLGEGSLALWLLIMGVDAAKWQARASQAASSAA